MKILRALVVVVGVIGLVTAARGELSSSERKEAKEMIKGTLYLRIDAPCMYGRGGFGLNVQPMVEVSPTGYKVQSSPVTEEKKKPKLSAYWGFGPNDAVMYGSLQFSGDDVTVWMEGAPPNSNEVMVKFVQIKTMDDFKAAFNQTFSKVPLQDEHPEWPAEIRKAIADRRVVEGMTKRQAFCVVGTPVNTQSATDNGKEVETWFPRQENGSVVTFRKARSTSTGFPALLKFVDGKLATIEMTSRAKELNLDK